MKNLPYCKTPCRQCPFRKDAPAGWLGEDRMKGILKEFSFVCHKTTQGETSERRQCAGHMIIKGMNNDFVRFAARLKIPIELRGHELVFDNEKDLIGHHKF